MSNIKENHKIEIISPRSQLSLFGYDNHFDFFRIKDIKEITEIGFEECINGNIVIIEWPEIVMPMISKLNKIEIELSIVSNSTRKIIFY